MPRNRVTCIILIAAVLGVLCLGVSVHYIQQRSENSPAAPEVFPSTDKGNPNSNLLASSNASGEHETNQWLLKNTDLSARELLEREDAILLANAIILTSSQRPLEIPDGLKASGEPGAFLIQGKGKNPNFPDVIRRAGGEIVAYVPNNAYLVRISAGGAEKLRSDPAVSAVLPYEPWFKLAPELLRRAVERKPVFGSERFRIAVFKDLQKEAEEAFRSLGVRVLGTEQSVFGVVYQVRFPTSTDVLSKVASLPAVQWVEPIGERLQANDLSRVRLGVAATPVDATNYVVDGIELNGDRVLVTVVDGGVDATHPDLAGRVIVANSGAGEDRNGHGTHVAGIIASSGEHGPESVPGSEPGTSFRGKAYKATIYSILGAGWNSWNLTDVELQEMAARTNSFISNNSWVYGGVRSYDLAAASYDAAVRDALPTVPGSQPVVFVFPAGDGGSGNDNGLGGLPDSIFSPGTAKNVITVGAIEQPRNIQVDVQAGGATNTISFVSGSDSDSEVASYSGRGNVGYWWEGEFGRFKPDVVAPGSWVVSTRSTQWDEDAYYNPTYRIVNMIEMVELAPGVTYYDGLFVPADAIEVQIYLVTNRFSLGRTPNLPICVKVGSWPQDPLDDCQWSGVGAVTVPIGLAEREQDLFFAIPNNTSSTLNFDIMTVIVLSNQLSDAVLALKQLNDQIGPYYRFESGTSMAAAAVSGVLALMQQYFQANDITVSPALLKALLINGARSLGQPYDLCVSNTINFQGWGIVNLVNSIRPGLANVFPGKPRPESSSIWVFDQDPTARALSTGEKWTVNVRVAPEAQQEPLRITLVWTDPPGHPAVGVKLVNDLDLIVTNLDNPSKPVVYVGNYIRTTADFNEPWEPSSTNGAPLFDRINNVENVFIAPPLGTNYQITVIASRVYVNAVPENTNGIVQDFALVISCGDGAITNALSIVSTSQSRQVVTNIMYLPPESNGVPILKQRVGANFPLTNKADAPFGQISQWNFYVITNTFGYTNAAFITFMPPELALRRMAVAQSDLENAARPEGDIDLYVSTDPRLLELDPEAIAAADKSLERGGTEYVVYSNSVQGAVYYVGVKCEDQQAVEYGFLGVFSELPFAEGTDRGTVLRPVTVPVEIPDGSPDRPQAALVFCVNPYPMSVRRVVVTESIQHESFGDILANLSHRGSYAVLHNHTLPEENPQMGVIYDLVFEDNNEIVARRSDGPGCLVDFIGTEAAGVWQLTVVDNTFGHTGRVANLSIQIERSMGTNAVDVTILGGRSYVDFVDVPPNATNMIVAVSGNTQPLVVTIRRGSPPTAAMYDKRGTVNPPGGEVSLSIYDTPPLAPDRYFFEVFNPSAEPQNVRILVIFEYELAPPKYVSFGSVTNVVLSNNAVTYASLLVTNAGVRLPNETGCMTVNGLDVGLLIDHPRIADLVITLISPSGTRAVLFENRGWLDTNGLGTFGYGVTNRVPVYTTEFSSVMPGRYATPSLLGDWRVLDGEVTVRDRFDNLPNTNKVVWLGRATIFNSLVATGAPSYELELVLSHIPGLADGVAWWSFEKGGADILGGHDAVVLGNVAYLAGKVGNAIYCDGVGTSIEVRSCPELELTNWTGFTIEGWIYPSNVAARAPLFVWGKDTNAPVSPGVEVWLSGMFTTNGGPGGISVVITDTNGLDYYIETGTNTLVSTNWQHIAITYNAVSNIVSIYTNGSIAISAVLQTTNEYGTNGLTLWAQGNLYLGWCPGRTARFAGGMDEVTIYKRPLSECEVGAIYSAGENGKYGTAASTCPVVVGLSLGTGETLYLTNGLDWATTGVYAQTNVIPLNIRDGELPVRIWGVDPNVCIERITLYGVTPTRVDGLLHFTDNTNLATSPIKFAETPFTVDIYPPRLLVTNGLAGAAPGLFADGDRIVASELEWNVSGTNVEVVVGLAPTTEAGVGVALGYSNRISCVLPTVQGKRYRLEYSVRGPGAVSWWNGELDPVTGRVLDLLGSNHGELWNGAQAGPSTNAYVGSAALEFQSTDPKIELGDPPNLALTDQFSIEGWINVTQFPSTGTVAQIIYRGDLRQCLDPYWFGLTWDGRLRLHLEGTNGDCGFVLDSIPVILSTGQWYHVAAVVGTDPTTTQRVARLYVDGELVAEAQNAPLLIRELDSAYSPGVAIGNRSRYESGEPFRGYIDELTVYARALSLAEIRGIYAAGAAGKADLTVSPSLSLAWLKLYLDGVEVQDVRGSNTTWSTYTLTFTAQSSNSVLTLESLLPGTLVADVRLFELPPELYYQPEQPLSIFDGECAEGEWRLEIWDTRAGPENTAPTLLNWQLSFLSGRPGIPTVYPLRHGIPFTNSLAPGSTHYFVVDVPQWAKMSSNIVFFSIESGGTNLLPITVLYDPVQLPRAGAVVLVDRETPLVVRTLTETSAPPLQPGFKYYLAVTNPNPVSIDYAVGVWFDVTWLEPCVAKESYVGPAGIPRYFSFEVPTNYAGLGLVDLVAVRVHSFSTNLTVVVNQNPALPDLAYHDYISAQPCTNDEIVVVITNTTPYPVKPGVWNVGVFNSGLQPVGFTIEVCFDTNRPIVVPLTNGVPFVVSQDSPLVAEPGPPRRVYYEFEVDVETAAVLFEIYDPTGDAKLVLQRETLPGVPPYFAESYPLQTNWHQIVLRTNAWLPDLRGRWYLGVYNRSATNIGYIIRAAISTNGYLESGYPMTVFVDTKPELPGHMVLSWNSVIGERYDILYASSLRPPINWTVVGTVVASTPWTTYVVPAPPTPLGVYRVMHVPSAEGIPLTHGTPWSGSLWSGATMYFTVEVPSWAEFATNVLDSTGPVDLLFNQSGSPYSDPTGTIVLVGGTTNATVVLSTNSVPPLMPGKPYWLAVRNVSTNKVTVSLKVDFDIVPLESGRLEHGMISHAKGLRYYQFDVSSNVTQVVFLLTNLTGNADLVVKRGWPPPNLDIHEIGSFNAGTNAELILVLPEPGQDKLGTGRWFIGVIGREPVDINYSIMAVAFTNGGIPVVTVESGQPIVSTNMGGIGATDYYRFVVSEAAKRVHFELISPSGDVALIARHRLLPYYGGGLFDAISDLPGTADEMIVLLSGSGTVTLRPGEWYVGVVNLTGGPVTYRFNAVQWFEAGTNISVVLPVISGSSLCLSWNSLPGVRYVVEGTEALIGGNWTAVSGVIVATNSPTTYCVELPAPWHFFRVREARPY